MSYPTGTIVRLTKDLEVTIGKAVTVRCLRTNQTVLSTVSAAYRTNGVNRAECIPVDPAERYRTITVPAEKVAD